MQGITESNLGKAKCVAQTVARYTALSVVENIAINLSFLWGPG